MTVNPYTNRRSEVRRLREANKALRHETDPGVILLLEDPEDVISQVVPRLAGYK